MIRYPEMVGGEDRFDSDLMRAADGSIVAKGGAEGFQGLGLIRLHLGVAIKISDGNARAIPPAALRLLEKLDALGSAQFTALDTHREPVLCNLQDEPVGRLFPVFELGGAT